MRRTSISQLIYLGFPIESRDLSGNYWCEDLEYSGWNSQYGYERGSLRRLAVSIGAFNSLYSPIYDFEGVEDTDELEVAIKTLDNLQITEIFLIDESHVKDHVDSLGMSFMNQDKKP